MTIKLLTLAIIIFNALLLAQEVPSNVLVIVVFSLVSSLFIKNTKIRTFFKIALLLISIGVLRFHFKTLFITECAVAFVLILSSLKFWELSKEKDHFNMFIILSLLECSIFLMRPTFFVFLLGVCKMIFYFYYILKMRDYDLTLLNPKRLVMLTVPSLAFSFLLFYTFPRFTRGFMNTGNYPSMFSGMDSNIDFKSLGALNPSRDAIFTVRGLEKSNLPVNILYWRSSILWSFTSQEWKNNFSGLKREPPIIERPKFKYDVEVQLSVKEFLPTLDGPSTIDQSDLRFNSYAEESFRVKVLSREDLKYSVSGNYGKFSYNDNPVMIKKGLRLKSERIDMVRKKYFPEEVTFLSDQEKLTFLIDAFKKNEFEYSFNPPTYASLEDFLLTGKAGYCSHFASAFTFLARTIGLPARIVTGFFGGEMNPYDGTIVVREVDAHAWVEVFVTDKGWVKVDPTVFVAPERARMSASDFNNKMNPYISILNFRIERDLLSFALLTNASFWLDSVNSRISSSIINFDHTKQLQFIRKITSFSIPASWLFFAAVALTILLFWILFFYYSKEQMNADKKRYLKFLKKMKSMGLNKESHETASAFGRKCLEQFPEESTFINTEIDHYLKTFYGASRKSNYIGLKRR